MRLAGPEWIEAASTRLAELLDAAADDRTRAHWERYLKGAASFRGVPMAGVRTAMRTVWREERLDDRDTDALLRLTDRWFHGALQRGQAGRRAAAGGAGLRAAGHLTSARLAAPLEAGAIGDWNVCDWYATKTIDTFVAADVAGRARAVARWSVGPTLWLRRVGVVAFVRLAPTAADQPDDFVDIVLDACAANLVSGERFAHTGPGWVLRELSKASPTRVQEFVDQHPELSAEGRRMALARLRPGPYRRR